MLLCAQVVHTSGKYGHPANWAGYMLLGKDVVLRDRSLDLARSMRQMLQSPSDHLLGALRTLQNMVGMDTRCSHTHTFYMYARI